MSYTQVVKPNYNIPYVGGFCEGYVEGTVGQASIPTTYNPVTFGVYNSASGAWANLKGKHPGEQPPKGVSVALYFSLGSTPAGHTAIWIGDGRVASSTQGGYHSTPAIHPSLQNLIDIYAAYNNGCTYLGWAEYIGRIQVVKQGGEMPIIDTDNSFTIYDRAMYQLRGRHITRDEFRKNFVGQTDGAMLNSMVKNPEADLALADLNLGKQARAEDWKDKIGGAISKDSVVKYITDNLK